MRCRSSPRSRVHLSFTELNKEPHPPDRLIGLNESNDEVDNLGTGKHENGVDEIEETGPGELSAEAMQQCGENGNLLFGFSFATSGVIIGFSPVFVPEWHHSATPADLS